MAVAPPAAAANTVFPVETFGDTLIVSVKGDRAGFSEAEYRADCDRVAAALDDPRYRNLVVDFSLTNYVGGETLERVEGWMRQVRGRGGRAVACELSDDMRQGLRLTTGHDDWEDYDTRGEALSDVATETPAQRGRRYLPKVLAGVAALLVLGVAAYALRGLFLDRTQEDAYLALNEVWEKYHRLERRSPDHNQFWQGTLELDRELAPVREEIRTMHVHKYPLRNVMHYLGGRMHEVLLSPRSPDPRADLVDRGMEFLDARLQRQTDQHYAAYTGDNWGQPPGVPGPADAESDDVDVDTPDPVVSDPVVTGPAATDPAVPEAGAAATTPDAGRADARRPAPAATTGGETGVTPGNAEVVARGSASADTDDDVADTVAGGADAVPDDTPPAPEPVEPGGGPDSPEPVAGGTSGGR